MTLVKPFNNVPVPPLCGENWVGAVALQQTVIGNSDVYLLVSNGRSCLCLFEPRFSFFPVGHQFSEHPIVSLVVLPYL